MPPDQNPQYIPPQQYLETKKSPKKWIIGGICTILLLVGIFVTTNLASTQKIFRGRASEIGEIQAELTTLTTVSEVSLQNHPQVFYADLEYSPAGQYVIEKSSGTFQGDSESLLRDPPESHPSLLALRVEVSTAEDSVIDEGWLIFFPELIQTEVGTLEFRITYPYQQNLFVRIYLPNEQDNQRWDKLIWTGRIE